MDDVKEIQKQVAGEKMQAKNEKPKKQPKKQIVVRNTNTAMGKALAEALGAGGMEIEAPAKGGKGNGEAANATGSSSLMTKVKDKKKMAEELGIGELTLTDILKELEKPARDPREDMPKPILRSDILEMKDLQPGMILKGTVRNVIDFGAFVDIGVHQDGLVHISQITEKFIKHPLEAVSVGDVVDVQVISVDVPKKRIALTMKIEQKK